jgi:uncharacterized protein YxeA
MSFFCKGNANFISLFRSVNQTSNQNIIAYIPIYRGDIIGILGSAGPTTSLGQANFVTQIFGNETTLRRISTLQDISISSASQVFREDIEISRINIYIKRECCPEDSTTGTTGSTGTTATTATTATTGTTGTCQSVTFYANHKLNKKEPLEVLEPQEQLEARVFLL